MSRLESLERVRAIVASVLGAPLERVTPDVLLYQIADLDSMHLAEIAAALDDEFETRLPEGDLAATLSVAELVRLVEVSPRR